MSNDNSNNTFDPKDIDWKAVLEAAQDSGMLDKVVDGRYAKCPVVPIELSEPIKVDGVDVSVLHMKRPTLAVQDSVSKMSVTGRDKDLALFGKLTGINPIDLQQLTTDDYYELAAVYDNFFSQHPRTKVPDM